MIAKESSRQISSHIEKNTFQFFPPGPTTVILFLFLLRAGHGPSTQLLPRAAARGARGASRAGHLHRQRSRRGKAEEMRRKERKSKPAPNSALAPSSMARSP